MLILGRWGRGKGNEANPRLRESLLGNGANAPFLTKHRVSEVLPLLLNRSSDN